MLWIVQNNLYNENGYVRFLDALVRFNCDHIIVKPVPFTSIILPADFDSMTQDVETTPEPEFDQDQKRFIFNLCKPHKINNILVNGDESARVVKIEVSPRDKSKLIGKDGRNINMIRKLAQRHHPIKDVQIS